jgi:hypothetical protein
MVKWHGQASMVWNLILIERQGQAHPFHARHERNRSARQIFWIPRHKPSGHDVGIEELQHDHSCVVLSHASQRSGKHAILIVRKIDQADGIVHSRDLILTSRSPLCAASRLMAEDIIFNKGNNSFPLVLLQHIQIMACCCIYAKDTTYREYRTCRLTGSSKCI